ncbi:MAG: hypothetical protein V3W41_13270 [Planctomycetota bacterium]
MQKTISNSVLVALIALSLTAVAGAQVTYTMAQATPGAAEATYLPTAAYPNGQTAPFGVAPLPNAAALVPVNPISGGMASDDRQARIYTTDGLQMAIDLNPTYLPFTPTLPPPPGAFPIAIPVGLTPVTGLCFDDGANQLWACDANNFWPMNKAAPFNALGAPLPMPVIAGAAVVGLGYDSCDGTLWAVDITGAIFHFTTGGFPIGLQPVNVIFPQGIPSLAVNTTNGAGALFAAPPCSTQVPGYHITVSDGFQVHDAVNPNPPIPMVSAAVGNPLFGHTYSSDFQIKQCFNAAGLPYCTIPQPRAGTNRPSYTGPTAMGHTLRLVGAPPLVSGFILADLCPLATCWNGLWINPFSWILGGIITDAAGEYTLPASLFGPLKGFQISFQFAVPDVGAPLGYCLTNLVTFTAGAP